MIISLGGEERTDNVSDNLSVVQLITIHFLSRSSRIVRTCVKLLPFRRLYILRHHQQHQVPITDQSSGNAFLLEVFGQFFEYTLTNGLIPILFLALTKMGELPHKALIRSARFFVSLRISVLLIRRMMGIFLLFNSRNQRRSSLRSGFAFEASPSVKKQRYIGLLQPAVSVRCADRQFALIVKSWRSTNRQALFPHFHCFAHRSVVVPGMSETRAVSCPVSALIRDDLTAVSFKPKSVIWLIGMGSMR